MMEVLLDFFNRHDIPMYFYHPCIVFPPKVNNPKKFREFRPISRSNFIRKIISKLLSTRLIHIRPSLISLIQSCFTKGRSITENIMLAQEITQRIKMPKIGSNIIIKHEKAKAYERVAWSYI